VALRLSPAYFSPGQSRIDLESRAHLDRVYQRIRERPEARLLLCGIAVPQDRPALQQAARDAENAQVDTSRRPGDKPPAIADARLLDLAENRAEAVRTYLVSRGIDPERLVLCAPEIGEEGTRPRVELAI
jgi:outer membrane protein OmpA-like peptidoglycan-associated protein